MSLTIIDSDNYLASGIETMFFPGGEPHAKLPIFKGKVLLFLKLRTWGDVGIAVCVFNALYRQLLNADDSDDIEVAVFIPYFPGARQDKPGSEGKYPFTLKIIAMLFDCGLMDIYIFDPHSDKVQTQIECTALSLTDLDIPIKPDVVGIISPDKGATVRAEAFRKKFYPKADLVQFYKARDPHTGSLQLDGSKLPKVDNPGRYIIVDDICDGGGTFNLLAEQFFKLMPQALASIYSLELIVSHGIFSKGLNALDWRIESITTTNSWALRRRENDGRRRLTVLPLETLFPKIEEWF